MGSGPFAMASLEALAGSGHDIALIVCQPDRPKGRGHQTQESEVKIWARSKNIEVYQPEKSKDPDAISKINGMGADIHVVVSFGQILPAALLNAPRLGAVNIHASLLPKYRGAAPIEWAIARGELETGVCSQRMVSKLDAGALYLSRKIAIGPETQAPDLHGSLAALGAQVLLETLAGLENGTLQAHEQDETQASFAPLLKKADGAADFTLPAHELKNRWRAFVKRPGFYVSRAGLIFKVLGLTIGEPAGQAAPGQALEEGERGYRIACGQGQSIWLERLLPPAGKPMAAAEFARGHRLPADAPWQTPRFEA